MRKQLKITLAAVLAAALCGCSSTHLSSGSHSLPETPVSSDKDTSRPVNSDESSGEKTSGSGESGTSEATEESGGDVSIEENSALEKGKTLNVKSGETLYIKDGAEYTVDGNISCEKGGAIKVESGGSLLLNGKIDLKGELVLGGSLSVGEEAEISGEGTLQVVNSFDDIDCEGTVTAHIKAPAPVENDGITTVGGVMIVNKKYSLPESYGDGYLTDDTYNSLLEMREYSGYEMPIVSGFRSYETQAAIFDNYCATDGYEAASTYSAEPGHSEHQSGYAMDVTSLEQSYGETEEGMWLAENCYKFGFIIRYPEGKTDITGYIYEPWHIRYLGKSTAKLVHDSGLTLEEFLGVEG